EDMGIPAAARSASRLEGERHFRFALSQLRRHSGGAPLIAAGGGVASGKSTLAAALGETLAAPVLSSDLIRKRLAGIEPLERRREKAWDGLYAPAITEKVYAEMAGWAGLILASGRPVVVDATFRSRAHREAMRACAVRMGGAFVFLECR